MTGEAATTLTLLRQLEGQGTGTQTDNTTGFSEGGPQIGPVSAAAVLEALIETDFNLGAAIVRLRR